MRVCAASKGPHLTSEVDPQFGRARFFIIRDDETDTYEVVNNRRNVNAGAGAGVQSATTIAEKGCHWVVSGRIGPRAFSVFREAGIQVATGASGKISDAFTALENGELRQIDPADVSPRG
ncbi:MAG: NifB/NifX family molybdenum-iron cluster-binding protein [Candidatus Brocadiaceae bacterium]|jgi:predicted Fe-Mo cluster-binding NifX family protein